MSRGRIAAWLPSCVLRVKLFVHKIANGFQFFTQMDQIFERKMSVRKLKSQNTIEWIPNYPNEILGVCFYDIRHDVMSMLSNFWATASCRKQNCNFGDCCCTYDWMNERKVNKRNSKKNSNNKATVRGLSNQFGIFDGHQRSSAVLKCKKQTTHLIRSLFLKLQRRRVKHRNYSNHLTQTQKVCAARQSKCYTEAGALSHCIP